MAITGTLTDANLVKMSNAVVEIDEDGSGTTWAPIESWATAVEATRGGVPTADDPTLDGERHLSVGIQENSRIKVTILYDEAAGGPAVNLYDAALGSNKDIRWSKSGASGDRRFFTNGGKLLSCSPPQYSSGENGNTKIEFEIESAGDIQVETIP